MATALVTGVYGFTGRYLVESLLKSDYDVVGIGKACADKDLLPIRCEDIDIRDTVSLAKFVKSVKPTAVFHLAGLSHVLDSADELYDNNVLGTESLLKALGESDSPPEFTLLASSANVYGDVEGVVAEDTPPNPKNPYACSKLQMETVAQAWTSRLPITIVRPFNYTGVGQSVRFVIPKIVLHFRERSDVLSLGNMHVIREFGDVRDVADIYVRLCSAKVGWGPYNICTGQGYSLQNIVDKLRVMTKHNPDIHINSAYIRANEINCLVGDPRRLNACLGSFAYHILDDTLSWMLSA